MTPDDSASSAQMSAMRSANGYQGSAHSMNSASMSGMSPGVSPGVSPGMSPGATSYGGNLELEILYYVFRVIK
jgi:hypothetical protein